MTELERIDTLTNGELPSDGEKTIIRIVGIEDPQKVLDTVKNTVKAFSIHSVVQLPFFMDVSCSRSSVQTDTNNR